MSEDIVTRLRAVLHNDRSVELMNREAADEIDRKNLTIRALTEERDEVVRMANKLTAERDTIRRTFCFMIASSNLNARDGNTAFRIGAEWVAELNHWKCFEENN